MVCASQGLIPEHGGYRSLKGFQVARLAYDVTVLFVDRYIDRYSRTQDQMVQAARSGVQNIAEGSQASATSKKTELKLTQVARASLEELKLDYEDFLRQRQLPELDPDHPALLRFKARRCNSLPEVREWVAAERQRWVDTDSQGRTQTDTEGRKRRDLATSSCLAANAALSLLNLACYLLDRQVARLASDFEKNGGFTERLYRTRCQSRQ